jgi:surfactin family lipopeptide synthetase A
MPDLAHLSEARQKLFELQRLGNLRPKSSAASVAAERRAGNTAPLSLAQEQVWRRDLVATAKAPLYNESITVHRTGSLNVAILEKSLAEIIRRHEIWRTTIDTIDGRPVQIVHPAPATFSLPVVDLQSLPETEREAEAIRLASAEAKPAFDLKRGPLLRAMLVRLGEQSYRLFLTAHQLTVDGVSVYSVFPTELTSIYEAFAAGKESPLPALPTQYADFASWQRQWVTGNVLQEQLNYWQKQLAGELPVLRWPSVRPPIETFRGAIQPFELPQQLTDQLRELGRHEGVTLFAVLLAGFVALLNRYTAQEDIIVGTVAPAGRKRAEFQKLLGYFLNPVPLRLDLSGDPNFRVLLRRAQKTTLGAISHDDVPLEHLAKRFIAKDPSRHPFFQTVISLAPSVAELPSGWSMTPMDVESGGARWDLYLELSDRPEGALGRAQYNPDIYEKATVVELLEDFQFLLQSANQNPDLNLSALTGTVQSLR